MSTPIAITGVGTVPVARSLKGALSDVCHQVCHSAIADAGLQKNQIDGLFVSPARMSGEPWLMYAAHIAEFLGLKTKSLVSVENGGATALLAMRAAMDAIALGRCEHALVLATDTRPDLDPTRHEVFVKSVVHTAMALYGPLNAICGLGTPMPFYAMSAQRYMHEQGVSEEDVARVSVVLRDNAVEHPLAQFRKPVSLDDVLSSRMLCPPIRLLQAASISAGACALVLSRMPQGGSGDRPTVCITGYGAHHEPAHFIPRNGPITQFISAQNAAREAFGEAGRTPADVDVAEVYGVFGATELILYEDLGLVARGTAAQAVAEGRTAFGGEVVMNPSGGRISFGHPAGATPLYEVAEVTRQLRGEALGKQVENARVGLVHAEHGMLNGSVVTVLEGRG
jgi:acetyl-CoA C-acetyltransferase